MKLKLKKTKISKLTPDNAKAIIGGQLEIEKSKDGNPNCGKTEPHMDAINR